MTDEFRWWSANETADAIRAGRVHADEVTMAAIERIERIDPLLNTVVIPLFDRARATSGTLGGRPFAGVPMLLKDAGEEIADTEHWVGTTALRDAHHRSSVTTPLARQLEQLGFTIVGKSACPELSADSTTEPRDFPPTRNPWDRTRTVGGSSGGAAAAVAAGLVPIAHGSDGTGSLRFPASHCGVVTLKPSRGRIRSSAAAGQRDLHDVWTQFAIARDIRDLRSLFASVATPSSRPTFGNARLRIGLLDHDPIIGLPVSPSCRRAVHDIGHVVEMLGHDVSLRHPSAMSGVFAPFWKSMQVIGPSIRADQVAWVADRLGRPCVSGDVSESVLDLAARGVLVSSADLDDAWRSMMDAMRAIVAWWDEFDLLVTPVTLEPAWLLGEPAAPKTGMFCAPFSFTGQPALVVPSTPTDEGLPVGVQIVGGVGADELLLQLGERLQEATAWLERRPPPDLSHLV
jgi:amidase